MENIVAKVVLKIKSHVITNFVQGNIIYNICVWSRKYNIVDDSIRGKMLSSLDSKEMCQLSLDLTAQDM